MGERIHLCFKYLMRVRRVRDNIPEWIDLFVTPIALRRPVTDRPGGNRWPRFQPGIPHVHLTTLCFDDQFITLASHALSRLMIGKPQ
jgi:hypothetical protein